MAFEDLSANVGDAAPEAVIADPDLLQEEPLEGAEGVEPQGAGDDVTSADDTASAEPVVEFTLDGRKIPQDVRTLFKNPEGGKLVKEAWHERGRFRQAFPEGPEAAESLLASIEEMGGKDGLETLRQSRFELDQLDQLLKDGDTRILERVASQSPDAIGKLAPEFMAKWDQLDHDGCNRTLCGVIANTFTQPIGDTGANLGMNLRLASKLMELGQPAEAQKILDTISQWSGSFQQMASAPAKPKNTPPPEFTQRQQELDTREMQIFDSNLQRSIGDSRNGIVDRELKPFLKGGEISQMKREIFMDALQKRERTLLESDKSFVGKFQSYRNAKDERGARAAYDNKLKAVLPTLVQQLAREMLGSPAKPKAPVTNTQQPNAAQKPAGRNIAPPVDQDPKKAHLDAIFG